MTVDLAPTPAQDPTADNFLMRLRKKNTNSASHKATVDSYFSYWDVDRNSLEDTRGGVEKRRGDSGTLTNNYYDLVTDFYEYGWGTSFHFAQMFKDSSFAQCLSRHEDFLALKLGLTKGQVCLDVGCGVGGPLREIAKFSGASVVGLNNNEYQVKRCGYLAKKTGLENLCSAIKGNFDSMPFEDETFDAAYAIEATCHASDLKNPYGEVFRVLKPGGKFACYEWLTTPIYNESNLEHKQIIYNLEQGNSLPKLNTYSQCIDALHKVGFVVEECFDLADPVAQNAPSAQDPWFTPLKGSYSLSLDALSRWKMNPLGRYVTDWFVWILESVGIAPPGTRKISKVLNDGADALVKAGELKLFTPMFFFVARKPDAVREDVDGEYRGELDDVDEVDHDAEYDEYEDEEQDEDL